MNRVRHLSAVLLLSLMSPWALTTVAGKPPIPLPAGPHLFVDDYLIASEAGFTRRLEHPARLPDPIVTGPDDKCFQPYVSVVREPQTKRFRMWYGVPAQAGQGSPSRLAYIESGDGIRWDRPHRVLDDPGGMAVRFGASVIDEGPSFPNPAKRYKFGWNYGDFTAPSGLMVATSPDGFAWTPISSEPPVLVHTHDINNIYRDPIRGHYLATVNMLVPEPKWTESQGAKGKRRRTFQSTSDDLIHFTPPREVIPPDDRDEGEFQYYGMSGYLARGPLLIGLIKVLRDDLPAEPGGEARGIGYTALAWSRDGLHWERDREPFLDRNPTPAAWDRAMTWIDCQLPVGSETFLYYGGYQRGHKIERFTERQIGLARIPRDRYVARVADAQGGLLTTPPVLLDGKSITVNAAVTGELRARVLDAQNKPLAGFDFADCEPVRGDNLRSPIRWKRSISDLHQQPVSVQFQLRDGAIYAFELHAEAQVEPEPVARPQAGAEAGSELVQTASDFAADPKWDGHRNRLVPDPAPITRQDFGHRNTRHAGGKEPGEIGGSVERAVRRAAYAKVIPEKTLNDKLSASGKFAVTHEEGGAGTMFGWFNENSRGWRTPNSLAFRIDGNGNKYWVFFEYGTRTILTAGGDTFEGDRYQTTKSKPFAADGTVHEWRLTYDPAGNKGDGLVTFTLDGTEYPLRLAPGHKEDGATFNRFGIFNQQTNGARMEVHFDDVVLDGEAQDFAKDPGWWGQGNKDEYHDREIRPLHDYGYSKTSHAGGKEGEIGGIVWRDEEPTYYGDRVGTLTLNDELRASGKLAFTAAGSDSGVYFGWFNSELKRNKKIPEHEESQKGILAIIVEGPSRVGHYFRPTYRAANGEGRSTETGPLIRPDGKVHEWSLHYSPQGAKGLGQMTVTFDGREQALDLRPGEKEAGATFDRFGLFNHQSGGTHARVYLDDLSYTTRKDKAPKPVVHADQTARVP